MNPKEPPQEGVWTEHVDREHGGFDPLSPFSLEAAGVGQEGRIQNTCWGRTHRSRWGGDQGRGGSLEKGKVEEEGGGKTRRKTRME